MPAKVVARILILQEIQVALIFSQADRCLHIWHFGWLVLVTKWDRCWQVSHLFLITLYLWINLLFFKQACIWWCLNSLLPLALLGLTDNSGNTDPDPCWVFWTSKAIQFSWEQCRDYPRNHKMWNFSVFRVKMNVKILIGQWWSYR